MSAVGAEDWQSIDGGAKRVHYRKWIVHEMEWCVSAPRRPQRWTAWARPEPASPRPGHALAATGRAWTSTTTSSAERRSAVRAGARSLPPARPGPEPHAPCPARPDRARAGPRQDPAAGGALARHAVSVHLRPHRRAGGSSRAAACAALSVTDRRPPPPAARPRRLDAVLAHARRRHELDGVRRAGRRPQRRARHDVGRRGRRWAASQGSCADSRAHRAAAASACTASSTTPSGCCRNR